MRLLYLEDDKTIAEAVQAFLNQKGLLTSLASNLAEAERILQKEEIGLCLIDRSLPDGRGEDFCKELRGKFPDLPVIFITVKSETREVLQGFSAGADDYITKPFDLEILYSRIAALLRRSKIAGSVLTCGAISLDKGACRVLAGGEEISLSNLEYELLLLLLENKNRTVMRSQLLERLWDDNGNFVNDNTLTVTMKRLREKLHNPECIRTIRSFGYRMEDV